MSRCIYCNKTEQEVAFYDEHVIPRFLGTFEPLSPILSGEDGLVCEGCNSVIISGLENLLKEDTEEGLFAQQLNLQNKNSIRIRADRLAIDSLPGFGSSFFDEMFPFLKLQGTEIVVDLKPQVKIKNYASGYQVFLVDALRAIRERPTKFEEVKERLSNVRQSDISIFTGGDSLEDDNLDEIISLLNDYDVTYNERERQFTPTDQLANAQWEMNLEGTIDREIGRVLAKIIFHYFAYCVLQSGEREMIFHRSFERIRNFIRGDAGITLREIVNPSEQDYILDLERSQGRRLVRHMLLFSMEEGRIVAKLSLFGKRIYEITIGDIPTEWVRESFGCGHAFDPFDRSILNLTQQPTANPTEEQIRLSFGLFNRL